MSVNNKVCLIVEDQPASTAFITNLVNTVFPTVKVETVGDLKAALAWLDRRRSQEISKEPLGLVFVDLGLPDGNGVEFLQNISVLEPEAFPIVLTIYDDDAFLFKALAAGAKGYLLKDDDPEKILETLKRIESDDPPLSSAVARKLLSHFQVKNEPGKSHAKLSPREHETLILLSRGLTVPEVAKELKLSAQTVSGYVKIIYQKLHVCNRVELIHEAHRRKLI